MECIAVGFVHKDRITTTDALLSAPYCVTEISQFNFDGFD